MAVDKRGILAPVDPSESSSSHNANQQKTKRGRSAPPQRSAALRARAASRQLAGYLQGPAPRGRPVHPPVRGVMAAAAGADAVKGLVSKCAAERRGGEGGLR